eukprot:12401424-Karenia_brevis.AAC.2
MALSKPHTHVLQWAEGVALPAHAKKVIKTLENIFEWAHDGLHTAAEINTQMTIECSSNRLLNTSSAFSGYGTDCISEKFITAAANKFLQKLPGPSASKPCPITFAPKYAIEYNKACQQELLIIENGPEHVYADILDFVPDSMRKSCGMDGGVQRSNAYLRRVLPFCKPKRSAWCLRHRKHCVIISTDIHSAGSPCQDHSSLGKGLKFDGIRAKCFYIWVALRRDLKDTVSWHENVLGFGTDELEELLGDMFVIILLVTRPPETGAPTERRRQYVMILLKTWIHKALKDNACPGPIIIIAWSPKKQRECIMPPERILTWTGDGKQP